ncbi:acylphosphatase [candidate division WWE3 bacterium CG_4_9_14_0_2_um_filter_35_11]|uniref:acylphosphatase n=1 Tax=candidate division WWE3 bacterium CG_4_9_14_0_2_um_filter_35_11 TaxID=1975077 RepID=A0A2M8ELM7_UNCKA|nr:MAG: acylphosphatase [candidate division WWE3 bacterium CG10_big_fil_rev_8_21_14_0_10_35_32]PJC23646.1 MAG: acylphosphatase [candidate division WWE3 bacterium CG_4_9_14_0_2_um_filter_35_11]
MLKAKVFGFVQGVNYRVYAKKSADLKGIKGYVKNLSDGNVEVVADGTKEALDSFVEDLKKGPMFAKVSRVDYSFSSKDGNFMSFEIVRDSNYLVDQIKAYYRFLANIISNARSSK